MKEGLRCFNVLKTAIQRSSDGKACNGIPGEPEKNPTLKNS